MSRQNKQARKITFRKQVTALHKKAVAATIAAGIPCAKRSKQLKEGRASVPFTKKLSSFKKGRCTVKDGHRISSNHVRHG